MGDLFGYVHEIFGDEFVGFSKDGVEGLECSFD